MRARGLLRRAHGPKIVVDARWYFRGPPSGRLVTSELVDRLGDLSRQVELTLIMSGSAAERELMRRVLPSARVVRVPDLTMLGTSLLVLPLVLGALRPDLVMTHNFCPPAGGRERWVLIYDAIFIRRPSLFSRKERMYLSWVKPLAKRAARVYTISRTERQHLIAEGIGRPATTHLMYPAPRREFELASAEDVELAREAYALPERYLLALGRINVRKRTGMVLRAAGASAQISPSCPVVLAGPSDGAQDEDLDALSLALGARLRRTGYVEDRLVPGLVKGATALISLSEDEGFGLPPLEAMAAGTPVIARGTAVTKEVLGDAPAYIEEPGDVAQVAKVIDSVLGDPVLRADLSDRGRLVASRFSWDRTAAELTGEMVKRARLLSGARR